MLYTAVNEISKLRKSLCDTNGEPRTFSSSSIEAEKAKSLLSELKKILEREISTRYQDQHLRVELSQGAGNYPVVWHVCILVKDQKVSKGIYVAICFDKSGRGALIGCAESKSNSQGLDTVKRSKKGDDLKIDVDGRSSNTKYNDCFLNPEEFYFNEDFTDDDEIKLRDHIFKSIDLSLYILGLGDAPENEPRGMVNASNDDPEFGTPEKVYRMIAARRGQKKFRDALLKAYKNTCAISGCRFNEILEAAHIIPYSESGARHSIVTNGILLRADLHTLFDLNLLKIHPGTLKVELDPILAHDVSYADFSDKKISLPSNKKDWPENKYLNKKYFG